MEPVVSELVSVTGLKLHCEAWKPSGAPTAVIVFIHGYGDHVGRYAHVFRRLVASGFAVHTFDAVAHGRSPAHPKRGRYNVSSFTELVDDAHAFATHALNSYANANTPPAFIMGQSLGGLISAYVVLREPARWNRGGLVLMSAAADVEWTLVLRLQAPIGALLAALVPDAELVPAVHASDLSRNPAVVEAHEKDQLVPHGNTKSRMAYECLKAFRTLQPQYKDIAVPLLAMHGTADKVTSLPAVKRLVEAASSADKTFVPWEGAYHELFNEPEAGAVMDKLISWLSDHAAAASKL